MIQVRGIEAVLTLVKSRSAGLREMALSEVLVHVAPSDVQKARALVRLNRNVFAQDDALQAKIIALIRESFAAASAGGTVRLRAVTGIWHEVGKLVVETVKKRLRDEEETPGGKAALTAKYAAWKAQHYPGKPIGIASEALINGIDYVIQRRSG